MENLRIPLSRSSGAENLRSRSITAEIQERDILIGKLRVKRARDRATFLLYGDKRCLGSRVTITPQLPSLIDRRPPCQLTSCRQPKLARHISRDLERPSSVGSRQTSAVHRQMGAFQPSKGRWWEKSAISNISRVKHILQSRRQDKMLAYRT